MLSKLTAVLARSIRPLALASPHSNTESQGQPSRDSENRPQQEEQNPPQKGGPELTVIPGGLAAAAETQAQEEQKPTRPSGIQQIFELFKLGSAPLSRRAGASAYQSSLRKQKKTSRFFKGTLVDRKAE